MEVNYREAEIKTKIAPDAYQRCLSHFLSIYGEDLVDYCLEKLEALIDEYDLEEQEPIPVEELWTHEDQILITYADMVSGGEEDSLSPLARQHRFLNETIGEEFTSVHILPFFPSSSDDGFSVIDYREVDPEFGSWNDIVNLSRDYRLMADLVINHTSRQSEWFQKFLKGEEPYKDYFISVSPDIDLSGVTRPRSSPMLTEVETAEGSKLVWTTFSDDQKDVNFKNPDVLFEYLDIFFFYVTRGIRIIRMDAVAYIWKEIGSSCIHLPKTHEIVKLFRTLVDIYAPDVTLITETNVPHKENISYFGDGDETHMVYQFSLPPLLLHALLSENSQFLTDWLSSLEPLPEGCTYFNFTSSHDGIGVRPLEGLVPDEELTALAEGVKKKGGFVSYKQNSDKTMSPYELNITWFDAFSSVNGHAGYQEKRFLCSQAIMLSLKGVPGIYFHNLTGTPNYLEGVNQTGRYRTINRKKWDYDELVGELETEGSTTRTTFDSYKHLLDVRNDHPAFHPFGEQRVYQAGSDFFVIDRVSQDGSETILVISNITSEQKELDLSSIGIELDPDMEYDNLITDQVCIVNGRVSLNPFEVAWVSV